MKPTVLKFGIGYDLVVVEELWRAEDANDDALRLVLAIRCHTCNRISCHPKDVTERYCGACHVFHEDRLGSQQA